METTTKRAERDLTRSTRRSRFNAFIAAGTIGLALIGGVGISTVASGREIQTQTPQKKNNKPPTDAGVDAAPSSSVTPLPAPTDSGAPVNGRGPVITPIVTPDQSDGGAPLPGFNTDNGDGGAVEVADGGVPEGGPAPEPLATETSTVALPVEESYKRIKETPFVNGEDYRRALVKPMLTFGSHTYNKDVGPSIKASTNMSGVAALDLKLQTGIGMLGKLSESSYSYIVGGAELYTLRANSIGTYNGSNGFTWDLTNGASWFEGQGNGVYGYVELHNMWIMRDNNSAWGLDFSINGGLMHTSMNTTAQYVLHGIKQEQNMHDSSFGYPIGLELSGPHLFGNINVFRPEALGVSYVPGAEIVSVYGAASLNINERYRFLLVPRFTDNLGAVSFGGDLKFDAGVTSFMVLSPGFMAYQTFTTGTTMVGGFGELAFGRGVNPIKYTNVSLRIGGVTGVGGQELDRVPTTAFIWLNFTNPVSP